MRSTPEDPEWRQRTRCQVKGWKRFPIGRAFLCATLCLPSACNTFRGNSKPVIEFTQIPPADEGGPDKLAAIAGRVIGSHDGRHLVLFARAGVWWRQTGDQGLTILHDSTWKSTTHLGTEYAALLVGPEYRPPMTIDVLPPEVGPVAVVAVVKGESSSSPAPAHLQFGGYEWKVRSATSNRNGFPSSYDPGNAEVDSQGALHLHVVHKSDRWTCAEVTLAQSLGYGTYLFSVRDVSGLDPNLVFSMFTWDELGSDQNHREMDIEISRWGDAESTNARYVIQPYYIPANVAGFAAPSGPLTHSLKWEPGEASLESFRGSMTTAKSRLFAQHRFLSGVPSQGGESVRMNFCYVGLSKLPHQNQSEVVVDGFQYFP